MYKYVFYNGFYVFCKSDISSHWQNMALQIAFLCTNKKTRKALNLGQKSSIECTVDDPSQSNRLEIKNDYFSVVLLLRHSYNQDIDYAKSCVI